MAQLVDIAGLNYRYPDQINDALADLDISIQSGTTLISGDSGSGKSTLLRLCNGLVPHFHGGHISGTVDVFGHDTFRSRPKELSHYVGFLFQDVERQFVATHVEREIAFGLENRGVATSAMQQKVRDAMDQCGVGHLAGRRLATLSGGERQRVAIASILVLKPELLVLDEPLSQLDSRGATQTVELCRQLANDGLSLVVAEHRLEKVRGLSDRIISLDDGRVVENCLDLLGSASFPKPPQDFTEEAWSLSNITAGIAAPLLESVNLSGHKGEIVALIGDNGSGKTTLLRTLAGFLTPRHGRVNTAPGRIAYLPQDPASILYRSSVREEVETTLSRCRRRGSAAEIIDELGLSDVADRNPRDLSSGQRQRAAIAAVLAGNPDIALLDEPTRGMDRRARAQLINVARRLAQNGTSVVIATHDEGLASAADRLYAVGDGTVQAVPQLMQVAPR